jgi:type I site-specific restriction endonuclease
MQRKRQVELLIIEYSDLSVEELQHSIGQYETSSKASTSLDEKRVYSYHIEALQAVLLQKK